MKELLDVLDEFGCKTGEQKTRNEIHEKGLWHRVAVVAVVDENHYILMQKRAHDKKQFPDTWDISVAGHVDAGEVSLMAAVRELSEELGLHCQPNDLVFITSFRDSVVHPSGVIENEYFDVFLLKVKRLALSDLKMQLEEVQEIAIFTLEEVMQLSSEGKLAAKGEAYKEIKRYLKV